MRIPPKVRNVLGKLPSVEFHCRCCHAHHHGRQGYTEILMRTEGAQACCSNSAWVRLTPKTKHICVCMCACFGHVSPLACLHSFSRPPVFFFFCCCCTRHAKHVLLRLAALHHTSQTCVSSSHIFASADMCSQVQPFLAQTLTNATTPTSTKNNNSSFVFPGISSPKKKMEGKERRSCCFCWRSGKTERQVSPVRVWLLRDVKLTPW